MTKLVRNTQRLRAAPSLLDGESDLDQPYSYQRRRDFVEPDWRRIPAYSDVSSKDWESALWQRRHTIKNLKDLSIALGNLLPASLAESIARDQRERATMSILVTPHLLNTMNVASLWDDPARRYLIPAFEDRNREWASHPKATRDSLHEAEMWKSEGLTARYPTKVLAELLATCPQYCGHCTRMDLVGNDVPQVSKARFLLPQEQRWSAMLDYLRATPSIRDVVVSGGDVANLPIAQLEAFMNALLEIPSIRDIRLASKGLMGLPQHWLQDRVTEALARVAKRALERDVSLAIHTHVNHVNQVTPMMAKAVRRLLEIGFRDVRNQGVLLRGINTTTNDLLALCFSLLDDARVMPYYFYMCDMIPNAEHWRTPLALAQRLQHDIMGYLPGYATPRIVCDVPYVGKRWVHQAVTYDQVRGISYWTKNYRTGIERGHRDALARRYPYYDPIDTLPERGRAWWRCRYPANDVSQISEPQTDWAATAQT